MSGAGELARLASSERFLRAIIDNEPECVKLVSAQGRLLQMNPAGLAMLEAASLEEVQAKPLLDYVLPEHRDAFARLHRRVIGGEAGTLEFEVRGLKGGRRWLETHAVRLHDGDHAPVLLGITRDITARKRAEDALRASEQRFRAYTESAPDALLITDESGEILLANAQAERLFGYSRAELAGRRIDTLVPGRYRAAHALHRERFQLEARARPMGAGAPLHALRKDGSEFPVEISLSPLHDGGRVVVSCAIRDVSERARAAQALEDERRKLRGIVDNMPALVCLLSADGRILDMNRLLLRFVGRTREALAGQVFAEGQWCGHSEAVRVRSILARARGGESVRQDLTAVGADGGVRHFDTSFAPLRDSNGAMAQILVAAVDITERHRAETALRESRERLQVLASVSPVGIYATDAEGRCRYVNERWCELAGIDAASAVGAGWEAALHPEDRERVSREWYACAREGRAFEGEYRFRRADGSESWLLGRAAPERGADGAIVGWAGTVTDITDQKRAQDALRESEERFRSLTDLSADWYWEQDENLRFVRPTLGQDSRPERADRFGLTRWDAAQADPRDPKWIAHREQVERHLPFRDFEYGRRSRDGKWRYVSISGVPIFDGAGRFKGYRGVGRDVTAQREADAKIRRLTRVYAVLSGINAALVRIRQRDALFQEACRIAVEEGRFRMAWIGVVDEAEERVRPVAWAGAAVESFLGAVPLATVQTRPGGKSLAGRAIRELKPAVSNDITGDPQRSLKAECLERGVNSLAVLPLIVEGKGIGVLALYAAETGFFDDQEMKLLSELAADISFAVHSIDQSERAQQLAHYDPLTALANRALFHDRLADALQSAAAGGPSASLLVLNLDRFKAVNDALGRRAGDSLLKKVARRLTSAAGGAARLARTGADSFAVLVTELGSGEELARFAERLHVQVFGRPFRVRGNELRISAKIGLAVHPADGGDGDALFHNAEAAMLKAKAGGEPYLFFTQTMTARVAENLALETRLRQALEREEFVLHYQPKVDVRTRAIVGMEALIRWQDPESGLVPPARFIPLMEQTGLILEAGAWALRRAALDHRAWTERGLKPPRVAVNVSAIQLRQRDFVERVEQAIMEGVAPVGIDLEITESLVMQDVALSTDKLTHLNRLGVRVAIDDFGTGYSSLAYLARLPVQALKIDRSFVVGMTKEPHTMALVKTIVSLAQSLRLAVIAEGVELEEQAAVLAGMGCDQMQGYLFSRPVPGDEMSRLLGARS